MKKIRGLILCEGISDRVLIGNYLSSVKGWEYVKKRTELPFDREEIDWYCDGKGAIAGLWSVGGNDFTGSVNKIADYERKADFLEKLVIVSDHDSDKEIKERFSGIAGSMKEIMNPQNHPDIDQVNSWQNISFTNDYSEESVLKLCFLPIPLQSEGSLENFMLDALAEDENKKEVIDQVKTFLRDIKTTEYLRKRREKIKAELGVSFSIFCPERMFDTMLELIRQVDWTEYKTANDHFGILLGIMD
jgi:hypothetical protein